MEALAAKLVPEVITVEFNFADALLWGETISSASVAVSVASGVDVAPEDMLSGSPSISGSIVSQNIQGGLPGVIYLLTCSATGSSDGIYGVARTLAVLSENGSFAPSNVVKLSGTLPDGASGVPYSGSLNIYGGFPPYEYDDVVSGAAPFWMGFEVVGDTLVCSGLPDEDSQTSYQFSPQIKDSALNPANCPQDITIEKFTISGDVPDGYVGSTIDGSYTAAGDTPPVSYSVSSGTFPPGLTLNSDGSYEGEYTTYGSFSWEITGEDALGATDTIPDSADVVSPYWNPNDRLITEDYETIVSDDTRDMWADNRTGTAHGVDCRSLIKHTVGTSGYRYAEIEGLEFYTTGNPLLASGGLVSSSVTLTGDGNYAQDNPPCIQSSRGMGPGTNPPSTWAIIWGGSSSTSITPFAQGDVLGILVNLADGMVWFRVNETWISWSDYVCSPDNFPEAEPFGSVLDPGDYAVWGRIDSPGASVGYTAKLRLRVFRDEMDMTGLPSGTKAWGEP